MMGTIEQAALCGGGLKGFSGGNDANVFQSD